MTPSDEPGAREKTMCGATSAGVGASDQLNADPANDSNQASRCGHSAGGWSWRCRCGPVACPVDPTSPTGSPAERACPGTTFESSTARWQYVQTCPSAVL